MLIEASGNSVRDALAAARQIAGLKLKDSREVIRSGGEDGLYRCTLADETVVEVTLIQHSSATATILN